MGLGVQMLGWHEGFCQMLVDRGFFVIRFDNRDVGLSTQDRGRRRCPNVLALMARRHSSREPTRSTTWPTTRPACSMRSASTRAHVVGVSMGGMIAQTLAIKHPERVLSLTSIMSTTGDPAVGQPRRRRWRR